MELKTCDYCGTEYRSDLSQCPLCGKSSHHSSQEQQEPAPRGKGGSRAAGTVAASRRSRSKGKRTAQRSQRIPGWMWAVTCVILGIAVAIGIFYFVYVMGFIGQKKSDEDFKVPPQQEQQEQQEPTRAPAQEQTPEQTQQEQTPQIDPNVRPCTALTVSQTSILLDEQGGYFFLTVLAEPADCTDPVVYTSSDPDVVSAEGSGSSCMITALQPGTAQITITCGSMTKTCTVICDFEPQPQKPDSETGASSGGTADTQDTPEAPSLNTVDFTLFHPGEETTIKVRNAPAGAAISFTSSDPSVAAVTAGGVVKAVGSGNATITVMVNDVKLTCIARCSLGDSAEHAGGTEEPPAPAGSYTISHTDVTLFVLGESFHLALIDESGTEAGGISWSSSNTGVCTVSGAAVTAVGSGTATVSATYGGKTYSCIVRCTLG